MKTSNEDFFLKFVDLLRDTASLASNCLHLLPPFTWDLKYRCVWKVNVKLYLESLYFFKFVKQAMYIFPMQFIIYIYIYIYYNVYFKVKLLVMYILKLNITVQLIQPWH